MTIIKDASKRHKGKQEAGKDFTKIDLWKSDRRLQKGGDFDLTVKLQKSQLAVTVKDVFGKKIQDLTNFDLKSYLI